MVVMHKNPASPKCRAKPFNKHVRTAFIEKCQQPGTLRQSNAACATAWPQHRPAPTSHQDTSHTSHTTPTSSHTESGSAPPSGLGASAAWETARNRTSPPWSARPEDCRSARAQDTPEAAAKTDQPQGVGPERWPRSSSAAAHRTRRLKCSALLRKSGSALPGSCSHSDSDSNGPQI